PESPEKTVVSGYSVDRPGLAIGGRLHPLVCGNRWPGLHSGPDSGGFGGHWLAEYGYSGVVLDRPWAGVCGLSAIRNLGDCQCDIRPGCDQCLPQRWARNTGGLPRFTRRRRKVCVTCGGGLRNRSEERRVGDGVVS